MWSYPGAISVAAQIGGQGLAVTPVVFPHAEHHRPPRPRIDEVITPPCPEPGVTGHALEPGHALGIAPPRQPNFETGELAAGVTAGIEKCQQRHLLARRLQLPRHVNGDASAKGIAAEIVWPFGLDLAHLGHVMGGHVRGLGERCHGAVPTHRLDAVERLVGP